ncbi:FAD-dependent oxidoreductase [Gordonia sp. (in: high G+C Gram-positive bacteria)]|uniref:NAD(P)/FAD-dependent oxidoreductase n=1 Tax=Gordonia sp. (in: high G+C Gram-positive bacteria) TaxID=84139 RepID=UPI00168E1173|nr:FAD-dependent oxidoreductase [Gordonia sp. (in: high G+C Gram-positive bacteria)]NLG45598.1 FAD-dependent oxidoreductase [Gordonia sp. (in: high G+C Gram-positive bacteria)]
MSNANPISNPAVIIGGGLAGAKTAEELRERGYAGPIVLIAAETVAPYERPPLSKEFLAGAKALPDFTVHDQNWYRDNDIDLRLHTRATTVDTAAKAVALDDGTSLTYSSLVLATGSSSVHPPIDGADADGVFYLRTVDEASALVDVLGEGKRLAVIGGGWIGLEVAAGARGRGAEVTVVEAASQPLQAALGPEIGEAFADLHREHGVDLRLESKVDAITVDGGRATGLKLADGSTVAADAVLIAVGARPNIEIAEAAGLAVADRGVAVDAGLRTSADDVYAVGDIAAAEHPTLQTRVRTEHWANALNQPAVAAQNILGTAAEYSRMPYFFTDQYDLGMEYRGHSDGYSRVVTRGDVAGREFLAFWVDDDGTVLAGMNVNIWDAGDDIAALVESRRPVDVAKLADPTVPLADLLS